MGNILSSYENSANQLIFCPPNTPKKYFQHLVGVNNYYVMKDSNTTCLLVRPERWTRNCKCIVFSHGNGSDIYTMYEYVRYLADLTNSDVYIYDYPGYGLSEGKVSEQGCYNSLKKVMDYVRTQYQDSDITMLGQSLGTGIVMDFASKYSWMTPIILISPYKSMGRVLTDSSMCSAIQSIDKFGTYYKLDTIDCPVKIFHGTKDTLINISHAKDLYDNLKDRSLKPMWLEGIGHNNILEAIDIRDITDVINAN